MADTFIQVPTDGSGKKLDTRTEGTNSEHRQVMVIGDPATNAGVAAVDATKGLAVDLTNSGTNSNAFAVTAASLPLPSGAATSANQSTANTSLSTIAGAVSSSKMATKAASGDFADGAIASIGAKADTAYSDGTGAASGSEIALLKGAFVKLAALVTDAFSKGTAGSASSDVITVQGIASMTPVKTDGSGVTQPVSIDTTSQTITVKATGTANGTTKTRIVSAASTNATSVKASAGKVMSLRLFNNAAYDVFFKFYDKASSPTVGTDTPTWTIPLKAGTGYSDHYPLGDDFGTGIAYAITKAIGDSDTTAVAAGDVTGKMHWI
jgi:hypothetical protein